MTIIAHRINTIEELRELPSEYGVEIDVRAYNGQLILSHDPYRDGERLEAFLAAVENRFVVFNIKESGIEDDVVDLATRYDVTDYFLLDVEFPYIYAASRQSSFRKMAIRFSEAEPLAAAMENADFVDWVWVDTNTQLPLNRDNYRKLSEAGYRICLVSPGRWGRPEDIDPYISKLKNEEIKIDAVMTSTDNAKRWKRYWS
jgi:hypothetical protein